MGILDNYKKILQNYKTQVIDEVKERVLGTKSEENKEEELSFNEEEEADVNDKIIVNLNDNPNYIYVDYNYAELALGDDLFNPESGDDTSWAECYGAARYEIELNKFTPGKLHEQTSKKFDNSITKEQKRNLCLKIDESLNKSMPVLCAVNVWEDGIEDTRKNNGGTKADHFVVIVGYGVTPKGQRFYLFNENAGGRGQAKGINIEINRIYRQINQQGNIFLRAPRTTWTKGVSARDNKKLVKRNYEVTNIIFSS
jgi:hypothetical protein